MHGDRRRCLIYSGRNVEKSSGILIKSNTACRRRVVGANCISPRQKPTAGVFGAKLIAPSSARLPPRAPRRSPTNAHGRAIHHPRTGRPTPVALIIDELHIIEGNYSNLADRPAAGASCGGTDRLSRPHPAAGGSTKNVACRNGRDSANRARRRRRRGSALASWGGKGAVGGGGQQSGEQRKHGDECMSLRTVDLTGSGIVVFSSVKTPG